MTDLPEFRRPWWHRWTGLLGEPRRRWRALDDRQRYQVGIVLRVILLGVLVYIAWPLALLVLILFLAQYAKPYIPDEYGWGRRMLVMAIGLNIVVGYAGLLDLGYVAFYAMGAYAAAWFASVQFAGQDIKFGAVG